MSRFALVQAVQECRDHVARTAVRFTQNARPGVVTHPIPFFGDIQTARVVTVGVNPSATEFEGRGWPPELDSEALTDRLLGYFQAKPHPWFDRWESVLANIGSSYKRDAAHVDLSPRATISQGAAPSAALFAEMLAEDLPHMLRILSLAEHARVVLMAGAATGALYVNEFVARHARRPYRLDGALTRPPGQGKVLWHELLLNGRRLPVYFCSSSPSDRRHPEILRERVARDRDRIVAVIHSPARSGSLSGGIP